MLIRRSAFAFLGAAIAMSVLIAAVMAQTMAPDEPSQRNKILVPRPDFAGAKQQDELKVDIGKTARPDFPGLKQGATPEQTQNPSQK